jgi:hypothetical protein
MNKLFQFLFFSAWGLVLSGQTYNHAHHTGTETTFNMVGINSKSFYIEKSTAIGSCCNDSMRLVGLGADGNVIFRTRLVNGPEFNAARVVSTYDNHLLTVCHTHMYGCDTGGERNHISKVDTSGNRIWNFTLDGYVGFLLPLPGGSFYLHRGSELYLYSSAGQSLSVSSFSISGIQSAIRLQSGNILVCNNYNGAWVRILDSLGMEVSAQPVSIAPVSLTVSPDHHFFGIVGNDIEKYDSTFAFVNSTANNLPVNHKITTFIYRNDSIFATGQTGYSSQPVYYLLDSDLNLLHQSSTNIENVNCTGINRVNNKINIISWGNSVVTGNSFSGFFQTSVTGNLNAKYDVGILQQDFVGQQVYRSLSPIDFQGIVNLDVTVKNFGTDTVKSFRINATGIYGVFGPCFAGINKAYYATLPPGGTITVNTGTFYTSSFSYGSLNSDKSKDFNVCVFTTVPGGMNDVDVTNDDQCSYTQLIPVGLTENAGFESAIKIFPNPSFGEVAITCATIIHSVEIFNLSGEEILYADVNRNEFHLANKSLTNGLYIFKLNTKQGVFTKKVLIE